MDVFEKVMLGLGYRHCVYSDVESLLQLARFSLDVPNRSEDASVFKGTLVREK